MTRYKNKELKTNNLRLKFPMTDFLANNLDWIISMRISFRVYWLQQMYVVFKVKS